MMPAHLRLLLCCFLLIPSLLLAEEKHPRESCEVCGMYIDLYMKTAAELVYKDGSTKHTCGVACMFRLVEDAGGPSAFRSIKVHEWGSGRELNAEDAYYVVGSKVIPDMIPNYIAFATEEEAQAFTAGEGAKSSPLVMPWRISRPSAPRRLSASALL